MSDIKKQRTRITRFYPYRASIPCQNPSCMDAEKKTSFYSMYPLISTSLKYWKYECHNCGAVFLIPRPQEEAED